MKLFYALMTLWGVALVAIGLTDAVRKRAAGREVRRTAAARVLLSKASK